MKKIISVVALLLVMCIFASCSSCSSCVKKLDTVSGGDLYDKKTGVVYSTAPSCYEAIAWEKEIYRQDSHGVGYHKVKDVNGYIGEPPLWLYNYDYNILLYNSAEITLPTLAEMEPDSLSFYIEGESKVHLTADDDAESVKKAVSLLDGPYMAYNANPAKSSYKLSFASAKYPAIVYNVSYIEYSEDQHVYVSLKDQNFSNADDVEENYDFIDGVPYEIIAEEDGSFTVAYNYGKYFLFVRDEGRCYMAEYIHDKYNNPDVDQSENV